VFLTLGGGNLKLPSECINVIDYDYLYFLGGFLNESLTGDCLMDGERNTEDCGPDLWWLEGGLWNSGNATLETVQSTFTSVVESITNAMRILGDDPRTLGPGLVNGTVMQTTTCIAISWRWLLFPALLIILTGICLVITMVQPIYDKVEIPLWKSSILPLLYASPGTQLMPLGEVHDMEVKSKVTIARLENSEDKWSFVDISSERA